MEKVLKQAIKFYKKPTLDWLNYEVTRSNYLTFHHIVKKCDGGKKLLANCALLTLNGHNYLHLIEDREKYRYDYLNNLFYSFYLQGYAPTLEQRIAVELILEEFERVHMQDKNAKGRYLIRTRYLDRVDFDE